MKKLTALLLALAMIFCAASCSSGDDNKDAEPTDAVSTEPTAEPSAEPTPDPAAAEEATVSTNLADITITAIDKYFTGYGEATYAVGVNDNTVYATVIRDDPRLELSISIMAIDASSETPADASGVAAYYNNSKHEFKKVPLGSYNAYIEHDEFSNNNGVQDFGFVDYPTENGNVVLQIFCKQMYQEDKSMMNEFETAVLDNLKVVAKNS